MATQLDTRDQIDFDELVRHFDDETKCEANHQATNTYCSVDVVAAFREELCRGKYLLVCDSGVGYVTRWRSNPVAKCQGCLNPVRDCWTVTPI